MSTSSKTVAAGRAKAWIRFKGRAGCDDAAIMPQAAAAAAQVSSFCGGRADAAQEPEAAANGWPTKPALRAAAAP